MDIRRILKPIPGRSKPPPPPLSPPLWSLEADSLPTDLPGRAGVLRIKRKWPDSSPAVRRRRPEDIVEWQSAHDAHEI